MLDGVNKLDKLDPDLETKSGIRNKSRDLVSGTVIEAKKRQRRFYPFFGVMLPEDGFSVDSIPKGWEESGELNCFDGPVKCLIQDGITYVRFQKASCSPLPRSQICELDHKGNVHRSDRYDPWDLHDFSDDEGSKN